MTTENDDGRNHTKGAGKMVKCHLGFGDRVKVLDYLRSQHRRLQEQQPSYNEMVKEVFSTIGITLSPSSLRAIAQEGGASWKPKQASPGSNPNSAKNRIRALEEKVAEMERQTAKLTADNDELLRMIQALEQYEQKTRRQLHRLFGVLNKPIPDNV